MPHIPAICCAVFRDAPDAIVIADSDGRIAKVNGAALKLFRCREEELVGHFVESLVPTELRGAHARHRSRWLLRPRVPEGGVSMGRGRQLTARRRDGTTFPADIRISSVEAGGRRWVAAVVRDVSAREAERARLEYLGSHDELTGLYNRNFFEAEKTRLSRGRDCVSVLVLDVDGLKEINDRYGHDTGDRLLRRLGAVLRDAFRDGDVVARVGGDEFVVLLPGLDAHGRVEARRRLLEDLERHNGVTRDTPLSVSLGGATAPQARNLKAALRLADMRMYEEKHARHGGGQGGSAL